MSAAKKSIHLYIPTLAKGWGRLLLLHLLEEGAGQFVNFATDYLRQTGREDIAFIAVIAIVQLVFSLLWSAAWILAIAELAECAWREQNFAPSYRGSFIRHFNQLVVEQVRTLAAVLWRLPFLIIPALTQYVKLVLVPFVVLFDRRYEAGEIDALQESRKLSHGHFFAIALVLLISFLVPWLAQDFAHGDGGELLLDNPLGVSLGSILTLFINIFSSLFLYTIFRGIYPDPAKPDSMIVASSFQFDKSN